MPGLQVLANHLQHAHPVGLSRQRYIEAAHVELEQARQQVCVIDIGTMRGIAITTRTRMNSQQCAFLRREARESKVVRVDEAAKKASGRVNLDRLFYREQLERPGNATNGLSGDAHGVAEPATAEVSEYSSTQGRTVRRLDRLSAQGLGRRIAAGPCRSGGIFKP